MIWFLIGVGVFLIGLGLGVAAIVWWFKPFFKGGYRNEQLQTEKEVRQELHGNLARIARSRK